ncbi:MAG: hypothetical protein QOJ99_1062 [Bryobacterales bacterium]|jgi:hypothetical protein|nr:hypothetical protein [Bryobacterales bacterium]
MRVRTDFGLAIAGLRSLPAVASPALPKDVRLVSVEDGKK